MLFQSEQQWGCGKRKDNDSSHCGNQYRTSSKPRTGPSYRPAAQLCGFTQRPPAGAPETSVQPCSRSALHRTWVSELTWMSSPGEWIKTTWRTCAVNFYPVICRKMDIPGDHCLRKTTPPRFLFLVSRFYGDKWNHVCLWLRSRSRTSRRRRHGGGVAKGGKRRTVGMRSV